MQSQFRNQAASVLLLLTLSLTATGSLRAAEPSADAVFFGIQMRDREAEQLTLPLASEAGIQWIRMNVRWDEIESSDTDPPTYDWSRYDRLIGNAAAAGFSLIVTVRDNPPWAATTACGPIDRVPISRFAAFFSTLVERYSQAPYGVKSWELYNEPDNNRTDMPQQGGCWGQYAAQYAALLGQARPAMRAADPESMLAMGGLAHDFFEGIDTGGLFNPDFLDGVLSSPGGSSFDVMNFHYYRAFHWRWDQFGQDVIGKTNYMRAKLAEYQLSRSIIVTEIGHPSDGPISDGQDYSDEASSRYVVQAHARGLAAGLQSMIWFEMVDSSVEPRKYGLLRTDHSPKPAYQAYKTLTTQLQRLPYLRDDSSTDLEVYVFDAGDREKSVCWSKVAISQTLSISADAVWIVNKSGDKRGVVDGTTGDSDGSVNGLISLSVGQDPVYIYPMLPVDLPVKTYLPAIARAGA